MIRSSKIANSLLAAVLAVCGASIGASASAAD